ncbi:hypothetical protein, variant 2 [Phytophthora nicotianae CJ01A1]|uniref:THH1/TOM1/TOM3 domain-containing protein n=2 Tax=Phytophthora nicotianae TaxID=4792 RepID=W2WCB6_PHYNI|nr:hypothetical protein, variant 2 [Phytophthora nicotianae]ETP08106.1 hypothetical protein, variant 2 [Phytophthora nicotianae CJ01A1]
MQCPIRLFRCRWKSPLLIWLLYCVITTRAEPAELAPSPEPPEMHSVSTEQVLILAVDALFLFVGIVYGSRVLAPKPMTYLSEIAFPMDFCGKMAASFTLFLLNGLCWLYQEIFCSWLLLHRPFGQDQQNVVAVMETLVWGTSSSILWMEYRRGLTPSMYLRLFWAVKWLDATFVLVVNGTFSGISNESKEDSSSYVTSMVFGGVCYAASAILVLFMFVRPTTVTPEFIAYSTEVNTPSAYLNSTHHQPPTSLYGSFKDWELLARRPPRVAKINRCLTSRSQPPRLQFGVTGNSSPLRSLCRPMKITGVFVDLIVTLPLFTMSFPRKLAQTAPYHQRSVASPKASTVRVSSSLRVSRDGICRGHCICALVSYKFDNINYM